MCEEEEDWGSEGEWETGSVEEDDGCEPDSEAGEEDLADPPYYDTVADDDDSTLGSRVDIDKHLYGDEGVYLKYFEGAPEFVPGEAVDMVIDAYRCDEDGESSFNDDNVPESEREFFSSSWDEDEAGDYVPPLTTAKKILLYDLMRNVVNEDDTQQDIDFKEDGREKAIEQFKNFLLKKRAILAFKRLQRLKDADLKTTEQGAFFLEKLEIIDKKLDRPFYYEIMEPEPYKRLLQKRKKAIKRKYELYAADPAYRREVHDRTMACLQNVIDPADRSQRRAEMLAETVQDLENPFTGLSDTEVDEDGQEEQTETDDLSSFYDTKIPESEVEYFSSPFEDDAVPHPGPKSRRLFKYNRLLNRCKPHRTDRYAERQRKYLKKAEIMAEFKNFLDRKRAIKCLAKFQTLDRLNPENLGEEAELLLDMEIMDKKLHRDYYYTQDESDTYKRLLLKRRNAIIKKYDRYLEDPEYRELLKNKAHVDFLRIKQATIFDELGASTGSSEESSLNDTEIPTSDEEFMSAPEIKLPKIFHKPITRNKEALYKILEKYEADQFDSQDVISRKQQARLAAIQNYREQLIDRRKVKAIGRLDRVNRMGIDDPGIRANKLEELELRDKKLNRKYYYMPKEPKPYTDLLKKQRRAIHRKYEKYVKDKDFRQKMENRLRRQVYQLPKKRIEKASETEATLSEEDLVFDRPESIRRSMLPTERKVLRRRECAVAGIWPKHRESAPAKLRRPIKVGKDFIPYYEHLSMGYGLDEYEGGNKFYHEEMLKLWCEEEEDWGSEGEWETGSVEEDDGCEPDSEAGEEDLADPPYYDTVADDDDSTLGSRVDIDKHLYGDEGVYLKYFEGAPEFVPGEAVDMVIDAYRCDEDGESSFNDDNVPESEREFFSSSWDEDEAGDYVPPLTTAKKILLYDLMRNVVNEDDTQQDIDFKEDGREKAIEQFKNFLLKKKVILAFKRLQRLKDADLKTTEQGAFFLEKLEIIDKKLDRPFYYEIMEPEPYKRLLQKRKKAIKRKYELYAADPAYRREVHDRTMACLQNVIDPADRSQRRAEMLAETVQDLENPFTGLSDTEVDEDGQEEQTETDDLSSFYDTKIPESEVEYFSSPFEDDAVPHPGPKSRRLFKYNRLLNRCKARRADTYRERQRKYLKKVEIMAEFKNFLDRKRAIKCLAKFQTLDRLNPENLGEEAELLLDMEIMDKKLHRDYYYTQDESDTYKRLLLKRRNAIIKKYDRYLEDPEYRELLKNKAHVDFLRIKQATIFDELGASTGSSEESSLNDTEIPTSDEEFMSAPEVKLPKIFKKPITRNKEALYKILEKYEADKFDSQDVISRKQQARLAAIQNYREQLIDRRKVKAIGRLDRVNRMAIDDPGIRANKLEELELRDKKLDRKYYYMPNEPKAFTELLKKQRRAIHRKYEKYVKDKDFRQKMENRLRKQVYQLPKKRIEREAENDVDILKDQERCLHDRPEKRRRSMMPTERKVLRRRECALAGIWPKRRASALPKMERPIRTDEEGRQHIEHLSLGYGLDKYEGANKYHQMKYLVDKRYH